MSTLQSTSRRDRRGSVAGEAWFALGILIAIAVGFIMLGSGRTTHGAISHRYVVPCPPACAGVTHGSSPAPSAVVGEHPMSTPPGITYLRAVH